MTMIYSINREKKTNNEADNRDSRQLMQSQKAIDEKYKIL